MGGYYRERLPSGCTVLRDPARYERAAGRRYENGVVKACARASYVRIASSPSVDYTTVSPNHRTPPPEPLRRGFTLRARDPKLWRALLSACRCPLAQTDGPPACRARPRPPTQYAATAAAAAVGWTTTTTTTMAQLLIERRRRPKQLGPSLHTRTHRARIRAVPSLSHSLALKFAHAYYTIIYLLPGAVVARHPLLNISRFSHSFTSPSGTSYYASADAVPLRVQLYLYIYIYAVQSYIIITCTLYYTLRGHRHRRATTLGRCLVN